MTVEFNAESWRAASNRTRGVLNILMPFLEQATTGTPLGGVSQNPVDRAIFDGLHDRNRELFCIQMAIGHRLESEAAKMTDTGDDYFATEEEGSKEAERIW